jgi:hypothetical protein
VELRMGAGTIFLKNGNYEKNYLSTKMGFP